MQKVEGSSPFIRLFLGRSTSQGRTRVTLSAQTMNSRTIRRLSGAACLVLAMATLGVGAGASAAAKKSSPLKVTAPKAGAVPLGKIPVRAKLKVSRKAHVVRARFYIGKKLVTTDRRYPFAIKRKVKFDTRNLPAAGATLRLTVRYETRTKSGKLKKRKLVKKIFLRLAPGGGLIDQSGEPDPLAPGTPTGPVDPGDQLPYDASKLPPCPEGMLICEDFDGTTLDRRLWNDQRSDAGAGNYPWYAWNAGMEGAHYSPDNVAVAGGALTLSVTDQPSGYAPGCPAFDFSKPITAASISGNDPCMVHPRPKTTGSVNTDRKFSFRYGTMEARLKYDHCGACWQSFWLHNQAAGNNRPEFDIMESMPWAEHPEGGAPVASPYTVLHGLVGPSAEGGAQTGNVTEQLSGRTSGINNGWHTFRITRRPGLMQISIDANPAWSCQVTDPNLAVSNFMFPILSMAIIDAPRAKANHNLTVTPAPAGSKLTVDYLKAWKLGQGPELLQGVRGCTIAPM